MRISSRSAGSRCFATFVIAYALILSLYAPFASNRVKASGDPERLKPSGPSPLSTTLVSTQRDQNRGMPPTPPLPPAQRPGEAESNSQRESRVVRLELNLRGPVMLRPGETVQLVAVPLDAEGNPVHGAAPEWQSLSGETISISKQGVMSALKTGTTVVQSSVGQRTASLPITVVGESVSRNQKPPRNAERKFGLRLANRSPQSKGASSLMFAHSNALPAPLPAGQAEQLYKPNNAVGAPPGTTTRGASTPGAAINTTETPGSANFTFALPVVSLPGRGLDLDFGLTYNSRLWTKSIGSPPTQMTYNMDSGWIAPGFIAGYGYLDDQSSGSVKQFMITGADGTRHRMVNNPVGSNNYESDDGTFIKLTVNGALVTPATAIFPGGTQLRYGAGDSSSMPRYYPTQIKSRNGNYINIGYAGSSGSGPKIDSIQDTLSRYVRFKYVGSDLVAITAPGLTPRPTARSCVSITRT